MTIVRMQAEIDAEVEKLAAMYVSESSTCSGLTYEQGAINMALWLHDTTAKAPSRELEEVIS